MTRRTALRATLATGATFAAGGLLTACSDEPQEAAPKGTPASGTKPKQGGTLRAGISGGGASDTLDAHHSSGAAEESRLPQLYEPLALYDHDATLMMVLAESMEPARDARSWDIRLREGVEFHNGKTLGADDLIYTFQRILNPDDPKDGVGFFGYVDATRLQKLDARTVRVHLKVKSATLTDDVAQYFNGIVPVGYDPRKPVGTGPFKFKSFTPGEESTFVKNENYWRTGQPYLDELSIINMNDDAARVNALLSGEIDAIMGLPARQVPTVENNPELRVQIAEKTGVHQPLTMRMDKAPFDDVRVRQAFRLMVDREQMVQQAYGGQASVGNDMPGLPDPMYASSLPQREQDIEQAKSLLKAAGHEGLTIEMVTAPMYRGVLESGQVFVEQAKAAGVNIKTKQLDTTGFFDGYGGWTFSQTFYGGRSVLGQIGFQYMPDSIWNETGWKNDRFTKLIAETRATLDDAKRKEILFEAQKILHEEGTLVIHSFVHAVDGYKAQWTGFNPSWTGGPLGDFRFREVGLSA
jgi:peptide/nickel transport system substrate-binding protein